MGRYGIRSPRLREGLIHLAIADAFIRRGKPADAALDIRSPETVSKAVAVSHVQIGRDRIGSARQDHGPIAAVAHAADAHILVSRGQLAAGDLQTAAADRGIAEVGVDGRDDECARIDLLQAAGAGKGASSSSLLPLLSKVPLLPLVARTMGTLVGKLVAAWKVPPPRLNVAAPPPWVKLERLSKPPLRL